jgi:hypothetical protein
MLKPNLFIVGAPKCGTTALHSYLDNHPDICMSNPKEPNYFSSIITSFSKTDKDYVNYCFSHWKNEKIVGEASPYYLACPHAAAEIAEFNPDAKIIIMLRNPIIMMCSLHSEFEFSGSELENDFEEALKLEADRMKNIPVKTQVENTIQLAYRFMSSFPEQVSRYYEHFPKKNILILLQEDLAKDTLAAYKKTLRFLQLKDSLIPDLPKVNVNKNVRSAYLRSFLTQPPHWLRALGRILVKNEDLQHKIRHNMRIINRRMNSRKVLREPMTDNLYNQLLVEKRLQIEELSEIIDRDLSEWLIRRG